jgi:hypothetical protein
MTTGKVNKSLALGLCRYPICTLENSLDCTHVLQDPLTRQRGPKVPRAHQPAKFHIRILLGLTISPQLQNRRINAAGRLLGGSALQYATISADTYIVSRTLQLHRSCTFPGQRCSWRPISRRHATCRQHIYAEHVSADNLTALLGLEQSVLLRNLEAYT